MRYTIIDDEDGTPVRIEVSAPSGTPDNESVLAVAREALTAWSGEDWEKYYRLGQVQAIDSHTYEVPVHTSWRTDI